MPLDVVRLEEKHLEDAALLVSNRYQDLRRQVPSLPYRYAEVDTLLGLLRDIVDAGPGVAAIRGGRLVGFLASWLIPSFRGRRSAFSPEWANGARLTGSRRIYEALYAHISASWVADGHVTHLISLLANDRDGIDAWNWLGFGLGAADAVRDLQPASGLDGAVEVRRAGPQDLEQVLALAASLCHHLASPPIFLPQEEKDDRAHYQQELHDPNRAFWLAYDGAEAVAYLEQGPASRDASTIIVDEKTTSITGAFTWEQARGRGIGTALLNRALEWARAHGYERCAVDFEPMNTSAARFWLRHFQPICYALIRHVKWTS
jgi:GNAT superfamily N-acetyltransferase